MSDANTVYAVDDDDAVLLSVKAVLGQHGYQVECFSSAEQFLSQVALDEPGCVVTDLQMPGMDGVELQRQLLERGSLLSAVIVTGVADVATAVKLMERGAVTLLEKPYDHLALLQAVEHGLVSSFDRWHQRQREKSIQEKLATLTDDETKVLSHMLTGEANKAVARALEMSMRTVDRRRQAVLKKMGVHSVPELALLLGSSKFAHEFTASSSRSTRD